MAKVKESHCQAKQLGEDDRRGSDTAGLGAGREAVSRAKNPEGEAGLVGSREQRGAQVSSGSVSSKGFGWGPTFNEQCWRFAEKEEGCGAKRVGRYAGV